MSLSITNDAQHAAALAEFERLISDESGNLHRLEQLRDAIAAYEDAAGHEPGPPQTVRGLVEVEMFKRRLRQKELAALLDMPESRVSEFLRGKRGMNLDLARKLHEKLGIPGDLLLELEPA